MFSWRQYDEVVVNHEVNDKALHSECLFPELSNFKSPETNLAKNQLKTYNVAITKPRIKSNINNDSTFVETCDAEGHKVVSQTQWPNRSSDILSELIPYPQLFSVLKVNFNALWIAMKTTVPNHLTTSRHVLSLEVGPIWRPFLSVELPRKASLTRSWTVSSIEDSKVLKWIIGIDLYWGWLA